MLLRVVFSILSTDSDFVIDMTDLLHSQQAQVYVAAIFEHCSGCSVTPPSVQLSSISMP